MVDRETKGRNRSRFFVSPELTQRLDLLRHLTENSQIIPVVLGPAGSGKSSLLRQICRRTGDHWAVCSVEAHPMLQPDSLLSLLADAFAVASGEDLLERLVDRFEALRLDGRLPVVVLDEAHLLPEATIITLLRLHERCIGRRAQVRILLFGEPEFDALLAAPRVQAMNTQVLQRLEMPRLTREQTEEFVTQALADADIAGMRGLSTVQLDQLFRESEGLPGRIERMLDELTGSGATGRWYGLSPSRIPPGAAMASILVVTMLLLVLIFQDEISGLFGTVGPDGDSPSLPPREAGTVELALPSPFVLEPEAIPAYETVVDESGSIPDATAETEESITEEPESVAVPAGQEPAPEKPAVPEMLDPGASPEKTPPPKAAIPAKTAESAGEAEGLGPVAELPVKPGLLREEWLLQQNPEAYTLQLVAVGEEAGIARFLEQFSLPGQAAYFRTVRQGKPWFPLLYGIYPDRQAAIAARARLPAELLQQPGAWPRSLGSVQEEIRNRE